MEEREVFGRQEIVNRAATALVGARHDKAFWFVKKQRDWCRRMDTASIDSHIVVFVDLSRKIFNACAVDHNSP